MVKEKYLVYRVLFLLHLLLRAILKSPFDNIGLRRCALDIIALVYLGPKVLEVLELDQMPDLGERSGNYGGL